MEDIFRNRKRAGQLINFSGCEVGGNKLCTDIDGAAEYNNKLFVFTEVKMHGAELPRGQELFFERLVNRLHIPNDCYAICLIATHNTPPDKEIMLKDCIVESYYWSGRWRQPRVIETYCKVLNDLYNKYGKDGS
jgi:hypothetical protein